MKRANKGKAWTTAGMHYAAAATMIDESKEKMTKAERKRAKTEKAKELADSFLGVIKSGQLFDAFLRAGERIAAASKHQEELFALYEKYLAKPGDKDLLRELEAMEEINAKHHEYTAFGGDTKKLKAADFHNEVDPAILIFDVCQACKGEEKCGLYMPSEYWKRPNPDKWRFYCGVQWPVVAEKSDHIMQHMVRVHGENLKRWPDPGCGARFIPHARGPSKVVEMLVAGEWVCFLAERLPQLLDDEIKKQLEKWHEQLGHVTAEEMQAAIPIVYPKTNAFSADIPGVSRFPFEQWRKDGRFVLGRAGWCALCQIVAAKDPANLGVIFEVADQIAKT